MTDTDEYGFFCDLENVKTMEYDEIEYYVVMKKTHYEVRRKFSNRPTIRGKPRTRIIDLACAKSSTDMLSSITRDSTPDKPTNLNSKSNVNTETPAKSADAVKNTKSTDAVKNTKSKNITTIITNMTHIFYYSLVVCCTTASCVYLVITTKDSTTSNNTK
jgi:hypothetical protein